MFKKLLLIIGVSVLGFSFGGYMKEFSNLYGWSNGQVSVVIMKKYLTKRETLEVFCKNKKTGGKDIITFIVPIKGTFRVDMYSYDISCKKLYN